MVLQHAKRIVAAGSGDAIEGPALGERRWKRGITIAGGIRVNRKSEAARKQRQIRRQQAV